MTNRRPNDPRLGESIAKISNPKTIEREVGAIGLLGSPDDTGVKLNGGRPGAALGPEAIRRHLFKMTLDPDWKECIRIFDCGDATVSSDIRKTHSASLKLSRSVAATCDTVVAIGGGHDFAAPHFMGFVDGVRDRGGALPRAGLLNVDPHLDVRELENGLPHSGTPFREILESQCLSGRNLVQFGFRRNRNSRAHVEFCRTRNVVLCPFEEMKSPVEAFSKELKALLARVSVLGVTIDMDSCESAEGTSAAPVVGFRTAELMEMARIAGLMKKVQFLEIAEVAPKLDLHERSARIAAEIIYAFFDARAGILSGGKKPARSRPRRR